MQGRQSAHHFDRPWCRPCVQCGAPIGRQVRMGL